MQESVKRNSKFNGPKVQELLSDLLYIFRHETSLPITSGNVKFNLLQFCVFRKKKSAKKKAVISYRVAVGI